MKIPLHLILIYFLCRIHPRPTMSDEVFCGELDKITKAEIARQLNISRPTVDRLITEKEKEQT